MPFSIVQTPPFRIHSNLCPRTPVRVTPLTQLEADTGQKAFNDDDFHPHPPLSLDPPPNADG